MPEANQTEKATPQRRKKAREQGQVARSRDVANVLALAGVCSTLLALTRQMGAHWRSFYASMLASAETDTLAPSGPLLYWTSLEVLRWVAPLLLVALLVSVLAGVAQGGFVLAPSALLPKVERLSPQSRLKQLFSSASLSGLGKTLIPFGAILAIGVNSVVTHWSFLVRCSETDTRSLAALVASITWSITWKSGLVLLVWSAVDYGLLWRRNEAQLRMSKEELKQEHKQNDGNPHTKRQVRRIQRAIRRRRSLQAVQTATLVITNPTHYAVALRYEAPMAAPEVVAKGRDLLAQKIKQIARDHGIAVMENKPLAQSLFKSVEIGDSIPAQLYQAVAEVLVIVYRAQAEMQERERMRRAKNAQGEVLPS